MEKYIVTFVRKIQNVMRDIEVIIQSASKQFNMAKYLHCHKQILICKQIKLLSTQSKCC